jgi:hypothetical protein
MQVDLSVLFKSRQPAMSNEEAARLAEDWNEDLEKMEVSLIDPEHGACRICIHFFLRFLKVMNL